MVPPTNCTNPVPIKFLTPSTSVMILDTKAPDLVLSKNLIGSPIIFFCTCVLSSAIRNWACTERIFVSKKEVIACTRIATATTIINIFKRSTSLFGMISSINIFRERGATKLAILLTTISKRPIKTIFLLGHIIVVKAFSMDTLGLLWSFFK